MEERRLRWDHAWKTFLDTNEPWCKFFITHLISAAYADYNVDFDRAAFISEDTIQDFQGQVRIADKFIQVLVDEEKRTLHFEFEAAMSKDIALRSLKYDVEHAELKGSQRDGESYRLPDSVIVSVHPSSRDKSNFKRLQLSVCRQLVSIDYPLVRGYEVIPELGAIMNAATVDDLHAAEQALFVKLPDFSAHSESVSKFHRACILLLSKQAYEQGLEESKLETAAKKMWWDPRPAQEVWTERGEKIGFVKGRESTLEEVILNLMENLGLTREQAERAVTKGKGNSGSTEVERMSLD